MGRRREGLVHIAAAPGLGEGFILGPALSPLGLANIELDERERVASVGGAACDDRRHRLADGIDLPVSEEVEGRQAQIGNERVDGSLAELAEIGSAEDGGDALCGGRGCKVEALDHPLRVWAAQEFEVQAALRLEIVDEAACARDEASILATEQAAADPSAFDGLCLTGLARLSCVLSRLVSLGLVLPGFIVPSLSLASLALRDGPIGLRLPLRRQHE
jgi:hypothetical protein